MCFKKTAEKQQPQSAEMQPVADNGLSGTKQRNDYLDVVKFVALFFMLWGHVRAVCWGGDNADYYLWWPTKLNIAFNMALFMVVSGYLFYFSAQKRTLKDLLITRSKPLLWTIVACGILYWLLTVGLIAVINGDWKTLFSAGWLDYFNQYWFLWTVLACSVSLAICCKVTKKVWLQLLLTIPSFVILLFFPGANYNVWMYPFFVGGYFYARLKDTKVVKILTRFSFLAILFFPLFVIFMDMPHIVYFQDIYITNMNFGENLLVWLFRWGAGFTGSISVLTIVKVIYDLVMKFKKDKRSKLLAPIGKNSLEIYVLSCIFLTVYLAWAVQLVAKTPLNDAFVWIQSNLIFFNFVFALLVTVAYVVALQLLVVLLGKCKMGKVLFGRSSVSPKEKHKKAEKEN